MKTSIKCIKETRYFDNMKRFDALLKPENILYFLLMGGFILGMIFSLVSGEDESEAKLLWLDNLLMYLKYGEIRYVDMLYYVLQKRVSVLVLFLILCFSNKGKYIILGGVGVAGGFAGYFLTEFILAKGILGSLLFACFIFPHYFCYGYGYYKLLMHLMKDKYVKENINRYGQKNRAVSAQKEVILIKKVVPFVVVITGMLLECYVNPFFVKIFLKIFM